MFCTNLFFPQIDALVKDALNGKDMTAYQRVLLKLGTTHPTSHDSKDCQIHVWLGPMEDHVTWLSDHRA